ncbi:hypothetical protein [Pseudotamlana agarivorans]|uniref:hypothetical protein n=1 Tax=Pseudotamlana agarivorans TaxID=481183 RepID=UPI00082C8858|nr:hypothetical protein [Tamlana agarivorans]
MSVVLVEGKEMIAMQSIPFDFLKTESLPMVSQYSKLLNWLDGEYELYLRTYNPGSDIVIYFPTGFLEIKSRAKVEETVFFEIHIKAKNKKIATKIKQQFFLFLKHFSTYMAVEKC